MRIPRLAIAVACLAAFSLKACGEKEEPPAGGSVPSDISRFKGDKRDVAAVIERYEDLVREGSRGALCRSVVDLGNGVDAESPAAQRRCVRNRDLGLVARDQMPLSVRSVRLRPNPRLDIPGGPRSAAATVDGEKAKLRVRLRNTAAGWRLSTVEVGGGKNFDCPSGRTGEIIMPLGIRQTDSRAALLAAYSRRIRPILDRGGVLVPVTEAPGRWQWSLRVPGKTIAVFTVEGDPPTYGFFKRDACRGVGVSNTGQGIYGIYPQRPDDRCKPPPPGPPAERNRLRPTVRVIAHAWFVDGDIVRAMYPSSGSAAPCDLRVGGAPVSRVFIRVLNPRVSTADLRFWCVETQLASAAPDLAGARNLERVHPSTRRQLRSGNGCVRVPYAAD